jgi:hypothetical protein
MPDLDKLLSFLRYPQSRFGPASREDVEGKVRHGAPNKENGA